MRTGQARDSWSGKHHVRVTLLCFLPQLSEPCGGAHSRAALLQLRCSQCQQHQADVAGLVQSQDPGL